MRIALLGFAGSRVEAPFTDPEWQIWGVNDVYAHVPRVDVTFELHHLQNLGNRRNAKYEEWMKAGCPSGGAAQTKTYMIAPKPEWPTAVAFPFELVRSEMLALYNTDYYTSSIAWMVAAAILELTNPAEIRDENGEVTQVMRVAKAHAELALYGIDMAADSEYASQRPAVEYYVGIARGMGIKVHIPSSSDLCKSTSVYGIGTTAPLAIKARAQLEKITADKVALMNEQAQIQGRAQQIQYQLGTCDGAKETWKYIERVWTQPTDIESGEVREAKDRTVPGIESLTVQEAPAALTNGHHHEGPIMLVEETV